MKKFGMILLTGALLLALCTGCGRQEGKAAESETEEVKTSTEQDTESEDTSSSAETDSADSSSDTESEESSTDSESEKSSDSEEVSQEDSSEAEPIPEESLHFTKEEYPRVDGATAMYPMSLEIAKAVIGLTDEEAEAFIEHNTTAQAYYNLIEGSRDLLFVSEPSDDILKRAEDAGVTLEMTGIGRDGFVFVVNKENPVDSLTLDQIRDIYTGKITNWSEVGGENQEIRAYQREPNSGSQNLMEKMVMKGLKMATPQTEFIIDSMSGLIDQVASYDNSTASLGYSIYLYAKDQYVKDSIKFLAIDGVYPTDESIADGSYPLSKIVYAVYRSDEPEDSNVRKLVAWLRTSEGQKAVKAGGYECLKE